MLLDKDIREPLFDYLDETFGKVRTWEEKNIGISRADIVMVTESGICGIEIKSDADSYSRLPRQIVDYDKYYDQNIIVVGTSHANQVDKHIPDYWGIITVEEVDGKADFYMLCAPKDNPHMVWERKMEILWKSELAMILEKFDFPKYKEKSKTFIVKKILAGIPQKLTEGELRKEMSDILFERDYTKFDNFNNESALVSTPKPKKIAQNSLDIFDIFMQKTSSKRILRKGRAQIIRKRK